MGPKGNHLAFPAVSKWVLSGLMVVGRLQILSILILLSAEVWKK